jgi:hypothetical protein
MATKAISKSIEIRRALKIFNRPEKTAIPILAVIIKIKKA